MEPSRTPPNRIDEQGTRQVAPTWGNLVDRQIGEAIEDGRFDDLPSQGRPLPPTDRQHRLPLVLADELARLDDARRR